MNAKAFRSPAKTNISLEPSAKGVESPGSSSNSQHPIIH
jgi:hypothetical protein